MTDPGRRILGLLAKQPLVGFVKTRLAAETSPEFAAQVASAFLTDTVNRLAHFQAHRVLLFAPADAVTFFAELVSDRFQLAPQADGDLGRRMAAFFESQFQNGPAPTVLLGVDSPTLPLSYIEEAFEKLEETDLVLGPATDGGYYLVGSSGQVPPIFDNMTWSRPSVLEETIGRLSDRRWRLHLLPPWYDVDTPDGWKMLRGHLTALRRAGLDPELPCTERLAYDHL
jgi:uncharacterized protein